MASIGAPALDPMALHKKAIVIDGLIFSKWSRAVFEEMRRGGITAANCTCSVWEGFAATMKNVAEWKTLLRENADMILQVYSAADIRLAKAEGKVGIILGWQNSCGIDDNLAYLSLFHELGLRIVQVTYNTQNASGSGCLETRDSGLSDFGRELITELNRLGILIDLSHAGLKTVEDTILFSKRPVCYTHCAPYALLQHPRNKTDEQLRFMVDHGGFVGASTYPVFLPKSNDTTVDDCVEAIEHMVNVCGENNVGVGTDFTQDQDHAFFDWVARDKGSARRVLIRRDGLPKFPAGFERLSEFSGLTTAMARRGWSESRIEKVIGGNWLRFLDMVWANDGTR